MVSVRCPFQEFKLVPTETTTMALLFHLAECAVRYGVPIHEYCFMSNHYHLVLTDPRGRLPDFMRDFNSAVARVLNDVAGARENVFSTERPCMVRSVGDPEEIAQSLMDRCVYTLANPVEAGLVRRAKEWPGATSWSLEYGWPITVKRPGLKFYGKKRPKELQLVLTRPPGVDASMSDAEVRELIRARVREKEAEVLERHHKEGTGFVGAAAVRAQSRLAKPSTPHGKGVKDVKPTVSARSKWHAIAAKQQVSEFTIRYRKALTAWKAGDRDVVFPYGTWRMARYFGVLVEDAWGSGVPRPPDPPPSDSAAAA
jgi:REP element-mobilizing transposase RayT